MAVLDQVPEGFTDVRVRADEAGVRHVVRRLFSSAWSACGEVIQNAYRAGATRVDVRVEGRTLTFSDNGPGVTNPQTLFTIARSGWDAEVVEPAGIGAFALYYLATEVTVSSVPADETVPAWSARLTPAEIKAGTPLDLRIEPRDGRPSGFTVTATLGPEANLPDLTKPGWRHAFPIEVRVQVGEREPVVVPPLAPVGAEIPTEVGPVYVTRGGGGNVPNGPIWEHRVVAGSASDLKDRVGKSLSRSLAGRAVASMYRDLSLAWVVDPRCGARPQLPDRGRMLDDAAFRRACEVIARALEAEVDEAGLLAAVRARHPGEIEACWDYDRADAPVYGRLPDAAKRVAVLPFLGFRKQRMAADLRAVSVDFNRGEDGLEIAETGTTEEVWVRPAFRASTRAATAAALALGIPTVYADEGDLPEVRLSCGSATTWEALGLVLAPGLSLEVPGREALPIPFPLADEEFGDLYDALPAHARAILATGTPAQGGGQGTGLDPLALVGVVPVGEADALDYILEDRGFPTLIALASEAAYLESERDFPWVWDYVNDHGGDDIRLDTPRLTTALALQFASSRGEAMQARMRRRAAAGLLAQALREATERRYDLREAIAGARAENLGPAAEVVCTAMERVWRLADTTSLASLQRTPGTRDRLRVALWRLGALVQRLGDRLAPPA